LPEGLVCAETFMLGSYRREKKTNNFEFCLFLQQIAYFCGDFGQKLRLKFTIIANKKWVLPFVNHVWSSIAKRGGISEDA
jgi:hypothetical protein